MTPAEKLIELAPELMAKSSQIALKHYNSLTKVMHKEDNSPLTAADLEVDAYLYEQLTKYFPQIPVITEERSKSHGQDVSEGLFFLVDPIDGTKEFINQRDEFTINIALVEDQKPIAGIVCAPVLRNIYMGIVGKGAILLDQATNEKAEIKTRKPDNTALMVVASRSHLTPETQSFIDENNVSETKSSGSSLKFCLLAKGDADIYPRFGPTMEWDTAAAHAVLRAAGGEIRMIDGTMLTYAKSEFRNPFFIASAEGVEYKV